MRTIRILAITAGLIGGVVALAGHSLASHPTAAHKTVQAVGVDPNNGIYGWTPKTLKIKVGTKVTWTNPSDTGHNVTSTTKSWTFVKTLDQGAQVSFTFKKSGTYKYSCTIHPGMVGKIVVSS